MELTAAQKQSLRELISWKIAYTLKPLYFFLRRKRRPWNVTMDSLKAMPAGSLGNDLYLFLKKNNLQIMPKAEFHDVYHVLFNFETCIRDEACIQFVPLGNGRYSLPYIACTIVSVLFYPEFWGDFYKAFAMGRRANKFHNWNFESLLNHHTQDIRRMIFDIDQ